MFHLLLPLIAFLALSGPTSAGAGVPLLLNYQGTLQTSADSLVSGTVGVTFSIYGAETGGAPLWSESHTLEVRNGQFHVLLGSVSPLPETLFSVNNRYLALKIGDGPELTPRQRIVSVAYALRAGQADNVSGSAISPKSVSLSSGKAALDTAGVVTAVHVRADTFTAGRRLAASRILADTLTAGSISAARAATDSLIVGGRGVIDRAGNWTGPSISARARGSVLDTLIVKHVRDTLNIPADTKWRSVQNFDNLFFTLARPGRVEIDFKGAISVVGGIDTRLVVEKFESGVRTQRLDDISNISGIASDGAGVFRSSAISNSAVLSLQPGFYRASVETRVNGGLSGTLRTGILIVRVFAR